MTQNSQTTWPTTTSGSSLDWATLRLTIDVPTAMTRLLGPAPGRRGGKGRFWWRCPLGTHDDGNPSFTLQKGDAYWKCYGCGESGDIIDLARRLNPSATFADAVACVTGTRLSHPRSGIHSAPLQGGGNSDQPCEPSGLPAPDALRLVVEATTALWSDEGTEALAYLHARGLRDETIRAARLGITAGVAFPTKSGGTARAAGITIPWMEGDHPALVKVRQQDREPRYAEVFRDPALLTVFPSLSTIRPGVPLVAVEGELDALLLGQELEGMASVVTLGSASSKPTGTALSAFLRCPRWYAAHDGDAAGDKAAKELPRALRVRPPGQYKDWSECVQIPRHPVNLRRWWGEVLAGNRQPQLYTWDELSTWRWGGANEPAIERQ